MTQVSLSTVTSFDGDANALIEDQGTELTVRFDLDEPAPEGGLRVFVDSNVEQIVNRLDLPSFAFNPVTENIDPASFITDFDNSGFALTIDEGATSGSFTIPIFDNPEPDTFLPETFDGLVEVTLSLKTQDEVRADDATDITGISEYTIDSSAGESVVLFADDASQLSEDTPEPNPEPPTGELPVVSFETTPDSFSEESEDNLVEWKWTVTGDFPEEGIVVNLDTSGGNPDIPFDFTNQFAAEPAPEFINAEIVDSDDETGRINILLSAPEASFNLYFINDILEEGTQPFDFQLAEGEGYTVDPDQNGTIFTITDDNGGPGVGPTVGISASATDLAEGDEVTVNFNVDGEIPEGGVQVLVQTPVFGALGQFDLADLSQLELSGIRGLPEVGDAGGSSFFVTLTEPNASITTSVFDDIVAESALELPFTIANGEEYEVDPDAASVTFNIADETAPVGPIVGLSVDKSDVVEGETITLTFTVEGEIPPEGIMVLINDLNGSQNELRSLTEFDVTNLETTGIAEFPTPAEGDSGFFVTLTEPTATITIPVIDEGVDEDEANESFTFEVIDGEAYEVDPNAGSITLNISDADVSGEVPVISIDTLAGTFDSEDNLITPNLVDSTEEGTPILSVAISSSTPVPEEGLIVNVNTDLADISEFVAEPAFAPFAFGAEFLGAVYNDEGVATGFQVRLNNPNAVINFSGVGLEAEEPQDVTLSVESGEGYIVSDSDASSTVTVYSTLDQVPTPAASPTVGIEVSQNTLIEGETETTITFNVDGEIPPSGIVVLVDSGERFALGEFDLFNAEVEGGAFPVTNGGASGFYFKITEPTASITLTAAEDNVDPETGEASTEGIEDFTFSLIEQAGYTVDSDAAEISFTIADAAESEIQVSLAGEPEILIEESGTTAELTLSLSAPPPEEGITVTLGLENLEDFDASGLEVTGGEVVSIGDDGTVNILVTEQTATINLPVADDGVAEGLETAVFTLVEPPEDAGYQIGLDPQANQASFEIYDTLAETPVLVESAESDDTIATSVPIPIDDQRSTAIVTGEIDFDFQNNRDVDQTEDVDMYSVELDAGDRLTVDLDSIPFTNSEGFVLEGGGDLRIFNAAGEELAYSDAAFAPGELLASGRDAYIDFTAESDGTYYIGVSQAFNETYDPNVKGSGDGALLSPRFGIGAGEYELNVAINPENPNFEQYEEFDGESPDAPVVSFTAVPGTFQGDDIISSQIVESLGVGRGQAALLNFTFNVDGEIPEGGLEVVVTSDTDFTEFLDGLTGTPRTAVGGEILGAVYNEDGTPAGFRALLTAANAAFPFTVSDREEDDPNAPESIEFSLASSPNYAVDGDAETSNVTFYDTLEQVQTGEDVPQVGVTVDQTELIESEGTELNISFNVEGEIPETGLLVYLDSETRGSLGEFDVFNAEITGGAFPSPNGDASGFYFRLFEDDANISLNVFDETTNPEIPAEDALEGIEEFSFSLVESDEYTVDADAAAFNFTIADNPDSVVIEPPDEPDDSEEVPTDNDGRGSDNDTIANAVPLGLDAENSSITIDGEIAERFRGENAVDASEDVDFYSFDLEAGQTITIDVDANGIGDAGLDSTLDSVLRIFNQAGEELAINNQGAAPDEIFQAEGDPYLEFTAPEAGTYYAGISNLGNDFYDPNVLGSGSGWTFGELFAPDIYQVTFSLGEVDDMVTTPELPVFGTTEADTIEVEGSDGLIFAGEGDDLIDLSLGGGDNRAYGASGDDSLILGSGSRAVGGSGDDAFFATSGGNNLITGGSDSDQFWIAVAEIPEAVNTITDFQMAEDVIGIAGLGIGYSDLAITDTDNGALISANGANLALILNASASDIAVEDNFAFA